MSRFRAIKVSRNLGLAPVTDECQIRHTLVEKGFAILEHSRYGAGRTLPIRRLNGFCRISEGCKIWARRCP
jgi:hypothetical protein